MPAEWAVCEHVGFEMLFLPPDPAHQDTHVRIARLKVARVGATACAEHPQCDGHLGVCAVGWL